jgi:hypothetical protein
MRLTLYLKAPANPNCSVDSYNGLCAGNMASPTPGLEIQINC